MSDERPDAPQHAHSTVARLIADGGSSNLADGEWHRLHPLTPLFKGGLVFVILVGVIIANMRDRLIAWAIALFAPDEAGMSGEANGDPVTWAVDWTFANNMLLVVGLGVLVLVAIVCLAYWLVWRMHQFRITGENVEVRKGIVFRSQRRAPLDRVQGVNFTRPFPARLIGMGKLTLEGAGTGADVALEYLGTAKAEQVRADILRLASGVREAKREGHETARAPRRVTDEVRHNVSDLMTGTDQSDVIPESVVRIPLGRLIASQAIVAALWIVVIVIALLAFLIPAMLTSDGADRVAIMVVGFASAIVPMLFAAVAIVFSALQRGFRYSIAPTPDGVRISSGALTTVTRTIPPGRVHAVEVSQNLLWRPFGWWSVRINRMGGASVTQQSSSQAVAAATVLPVGTRADVERVVALLLPHAPERDALFTWHHGILGPHENDPFTTVARRARFWHPLSWRRLGMRVTSFALLVRRGRWGRKLALFPLARLQGSSLRQGVFARAQGVAALRVHTVPGPVSGEVSGLDRADAQNLADLIARGAVTAAEGDLTHRWASASA